MEGSENREQRSVLGPRNTGRKTQRERREATVGKLVDATIDAIFEIGYARTSIQEICQRAGVSHGGLFRHFDTRLELIVAAADEVSRRLLDGFHAQFAEASGTETVLDRALASLRESTGSALSAVWNEVLVAARTDQALREKLRPAADSFFARIRQTAATLPRVDALSERKQEALVVAVLNMYAGAATLRQLLPSGTYDDHLAGLSRCLVQAVETADMSDRR